MRKINLLDWRTELIKNNKKEFAYAAAIAVVLGLGVWFLVNRYFAGQITFQEEKNAYIQDQIRILDEQIKEVKNIEEEKARLVSRMNIINQLQKSRPEVVRLFDDMVRIVPDRTYFDTAVQVGNTINFTGVAESNTRVSSLMRNIKAAPTLADADLYGRGITSSQNGRRTVKKFELSAKQVPSVVDEEDAE